ncbi:MAG: nucleotidyltransferase domain-containing protein [Chloroflexi bacterium]|nr:nucleotidyltransferase domain-containing protein [Chloroflexota bacterium]
MDVLAKRDQPPDIDVDALRAVLQGYEFINFAVLFGSAAAGRLLPMSDVDVGIHVRREISLDELGALIVHLERVVGRDVDVVVVNDLPRTNPVLAMETVGKGLLLFARDRDQYTAFKTRCLLAYMDTEYLRRLVRDAFRRRVSEGRIGEPPDAARTPPTP